MAKKKFTLMALIVIGLFAVAGGTAWYADRDAASFGGPFTLTAGDGQTVTDRSFRGKYMLVYFGYTICPDVCSTSMADLAAALDKLGPAKAARIQPLFITLDPARDTPEVLKAYTAQFWPTLLGLTGTPEQIAAVEKEYRVYSQIHRTGTGKDDYLVDHSSVFYLMGPDGRFIAPIDAGQPGDSIATEIEIHLP